MRFWLVQDRARSVDVRPNSLHVVLRTKRKPRIERGDQIVLFSRNTFSHTTTVREITFGELEGFGVTTDIRIEGWVQIEHAPTLDLLRFSLTFIYNFNRPDLHFRKGYRILPDEDFETIKQGEPFLARTTFFELLRALPLPTRRAFEVGQMDARGVRRREAAYAERVRDLWRFIREQIIGIGDKLIEVDEAVNKLELPVVQGKEIEHRIAEEGSERTDSIKAQANAFRALRDSLEPGDDVASADVINKDLVQLILEAMQDSDRAPSERRFERIFEDVDDEFPFTR